MGLLPEPPPPPWAETWPRDLRNVKPALRCFPHGRTCRRSFGSA